MSKDYSIVALIDLEYQPENIFDILKRGKEIGFFYLKPDLMQYNPILLRSIPDEKAALSILDIEKFLVAHFENTFFFFYISNKDGEIEICLNHFSYPWYKSYSSLNIEDIDILRYAKILMDLIMPWRILSFSIERK